MTLHEVQAQYALGLITPSQYSNVLNEAIKSTTDQNELLEIFWMIIDWENDLKDKELNVKNATAAGCHFNACNAFRLNEHASSYLRAIIQPLAKYRPLPERLVKMYPRPGNDTE
jgi:hypothetical protein